MIRMPWIWRRTGELVDQAVDLADYVTIMTVTSDRTPDWVYGGERGIAHGEYTDFEQVYDARDYVIRYTDPSFDYYRSDPAQWPHGEDGGTPMTLEELLSADEKMDRIDELLDEGKT